MTISETLTIFALGRLIIFLAQKSPYFKLLASRNTKFRAVFLELGECDLCLGVYVYSLLSLYFGYVWFTEIWYEPVLSEFFTGASMAVIMWLIRLGWDANFKTYVIE